MTEALNLGCKLCQRCFPFQNQFMASTEPFALWARRFMGAKVRLSLPILYSSLCTNPRVLQRFVPPMMPSVAYSFPRPLWESKCRRDTCLVLRCAAWQKDSQALPKPSCPASLCCGVGPRGMESPKTPPTKGYSYCCRRHNMKLI